MTGKENAMEWIMILKAVLALAFVLGLLLLTLWLFKYCELHGAKTRFFKKLQDTQRLKIEEIRRIDARNSVVLVKKDQTEYLLLLGANQNLLLETTECKKAKK